MTVQKAPSFIKRTGLILRVTTLVHNRLTHCCLMKYGIRFNQAILLRFNGRSRHSLLAGQQRFSCPYFQREAPGCIGKCVLLRLSPSGNSLWDPQNLLLPFTACMIIHLNTDIFCPKLYLLYHKQTSLSRPEI